MRHRLCGLSTYGLSGFEREISTPPTLRRGTADFTFTLPFVRPNMLNMPESACGARLRLNVFDLSVNRLIATVTGVSGFVNLSFIFGCVEEWLLRS